MGLLSVRVGTDDLPRARAFYDATFAALGVTAAPLPVEYGMAMYPQANGTAFMVGAAGNGQPATSANGGTILFAANSDAAIAAWHAAGLAHGGTCEGAPGDRASVPGAYAAYLRDPDGNKLGVWRGLAFG